MIKIDFLITYPDRDTIEEIARKIGEWAEDFGIPIQHNSVTLWRDYAKFYDREHERYPMVTFDTNAILYVWELEHLRNRYIEPIHPNVEMGVEPAISDRERNERTSYEPMQFKLPYVTVRPSGRRKKEI